MRSFYGNGQGLGPHGTERGVDSLHGKVMAAGSVLSAPKHQVAIFETRLRLEKCWRVDVNWNSYPEVIRQVCIDYLHVA